MHWLPLTVAIFAARGLLRDGHWFYVSVVLILTACVAMYAEELKRS